MSNPILTVFDDAGNAIPIPAFPWATEGGGGMKYASGTVTTATDGECRVTGLSFTPLFFKVFCDESAELDGNAKLIGTIYVKGSSLSLGTNASGTANAIRMPFPWNEHTVLEDDYTGPAATNIATALKTGFLVFNSGRNFLAGYTYTWEAWGE